MKCVGKRVLLWRVSGWHRRRGIQKLGLKKPLGKSKQRLLDLGDLMNGSQLVGKARGEIEWKTIMDRGPIMELLDWAQRENLEKLAADESNFEANKDQLRMYADAVAILGKAAMQEGMPDADADEYRDYALAMIEHTRQIELAVQSGDSALARAAAGKIGQSCQDCHDEFQ